MADFDYCITGAGCAGLSLLVRMLSDPSLCRKKILLVDRADKSKNDRTWCFWEKGEGFFEKIVRHQWSNLWFHSNERSRLMETGPFVYKMIRGIDLYNFCFDIIRSFDNVRVVSGRVDAVFSDGDCAFAMIDGRKITAERVFNSIPFGGIPKGAGEWQLLQHFKGWMIRSLEPVFNPEQATIMDFRNPGGEGAGFFYVLPLGVDQALVECTFFSERTLFEAEYTGMLTTYISRVLKIKDYVILEKELGVIPMTTAGFPQEDGRVFHIGGAAGLTKPSSGYTFQYIQDDCRSIVAALAENGVPSRQRVRTRFRLYDRILLNVLATKKLTGEEVFSSLFCGADLSDLFAFLDNASTPLQDWKIIRALPKGPFMRAAYEELLLRRAL